MKFAHVSRLRKLFYCRVLQLSKGSSAIYTIGEVLGKGNYGTVVKAEHIETKISWAIKIMDKRRAGAYRNISFEGEIPILKLVKHPNIIFLDSVFEAPKTIYLVFELCIESLAEIFRVKKQFEESEAINVMRGLSSAVAYLHRYSIAHRDLKLENILTADNPDDTDDKLFIRVIDFGLSAMRRRHGYEHKFHDWCGTLTYMAPEIIARKSYTEQCDVWSMGIIMYLLLFGKFPFYSRDHRKLCELINRAEIDFSALSCSSLARHLLSKVLVKNPAYRLTAAQVKEHPWITGVETSPHDRAIVVRDLMHTCKNEMLKPSSEDVNTNRISQPAESKDKGRAIRDTEWSALAMENTIYNEPSNNLLSRKRNGTRLEIRLSKNRVRQIPAFEKVCQRRDYPIPDFSHIPAKVDTNLGNLRRGERKEM